MLAVLATGYACIRGHTGGGHLLSSPLPIAGAPGDTHSTGPFFTVIAVLAVAPLW